MKLLTKQIERRLPALGSTDMQEDPVAYLKLFTPWSNWTWYAVEYDPETKDCFGLVYGMAAEIGYFNLAEIEAVTGPGGLKVERDLHFMPRPLSRCEDPSGLHANPLKKRPEPTEHDPEKCGCEYRGMNMWSCGHIDGGDIEVEAEDGTKVTLHIAETTDDVTQYGPYLKSTWCKCEESEFLCYPEDGACDCGCYKHHVHCKKCGCISQVG